MKPSGSHWTLEGLKAMKILISQSHEINLMDLGRLVPTTFTRSVNRNEGVATGKLHVYYSDTLDEGSYQNAQQMVYQNFRNLNLPMGYGPPHSDTDARIEEMAKKSQFVIILSGLLIYLLLGGMFESVLLPFAILFTVPLALLFGVAGLKLLGMDLDVMARLSLIILVGTSVNGAIILIDLINKLREQGLRRDDAIVIGCARRVKAVIMTMSIQIIGVLPVALGKAKIMGIPYSSLGISIISGTLMSTLVTLIVLPMIYEFLDESEKRIKAVFARILA
jgi:HAE1 family hydrophobic/amphiphilic exporter-1